MKIVRIESLRNNCVVAERCEVADSFLSRARGLLGRKGLDQGTGLWITGSNNIHMWFMRFAIDVVFTRRLGERLVVTSVRKGLQPWRILPAADFFGTDTLELPVHTIERCDLRKGGRTMLQLVIVSGPNRGSKFTLIEGKNTLGRQPGNAIILSSGRVSKRHCEIMVKGTKIKLVDLGSANGTYVNGKRVAKHRLQPGDRISIGDFVLALATQAVAVAAPVGGGLPTDLDAPIDGNLALAPVEGGDDPGLAPVGDPMDPSDMGEPLPGDYIGRFFWAFERYIMPFFYSMNMRQEWRAIIILLFGVMTIANLVISLYPLMAVSRDNLVLESMKRARFMARQVVERNTPFLAAGQETKARIGSLSNETDTKLVALVDLENRIIAPSVRINEYLTSGGEAITTRKIAKAFKKGREKGAVIEVKDEQIVVAVEPLKLLNARAGRNEVVAMAVVSLDTSLITPGIGEMGVAYSETLVLTALIAFFFFLVIYRLSLKRFEVLNGDIDRVLKGELPEITQEFQCEELDQFWDVVRSSLQRIPRDEEQGDVGGGATQSAEDFIKVVQMWGDLTHNGLILCDHDKKILYINAMFEDISGIHNSEAQGQDLISVARDQAFGALIQDIYGQLDGMAQASVTDEFEFNGVPYKVHSSTLGDQSIRGYVFLAVREDE